MKVEWVKFHSHTHYLSHLTQWGRGGQDSGLNFNFMPYFSYPFKTSMTGLWDNDTEGLFDFTLTTTDATGKVVCVGGGVGVSQDIIDQHKEDEMVLEETVEWAAITQLDEENYAAYLESLDEHCWEDAMGLHDPE
jgi:hypothetical protein